MGIAILPGNMESSITSSLETEGSCTRLWRLAFQEGDPVLLPGSGPSWSALARIREYARYCFSEGHEEANWTTEVYHPLLAKVFRGSRGFPGEQLDFMAW